MAWRVLPDWNPGKHNVVLRTHVESPSVVARLWNRFQETGNLTVRRNKRECYAAFKDSCSWQQDEFGCPAKQYLISFMREGSLRRPMVCIPLRKRHRVMSKRWAAEHRDWEQHDWS
ncbi:hypothetical protein TNCV_1915521 [Trichonephila clavipes]|uniref:Uncharacterized protein n=1 Tax=Trichonephila clavipes TaxID=2585209 RepID=A0A8X7BCU1_TRICX|nr:hypothetical protein TNCV_1915521 [Trichonephila clavipes]